MSEKITDPSLEKGKNKFRYFRNISSEEIIEAIEISSNKSEVLSKLNCIGNDKNFNKLNKFINDNNISISHFKKRISREDYEKNPKFCEYCGKKISYEQRRNKFCSSSCSASMSNIGKAKNPDGKNGLGSVFFEHKSWKKETIYFRSSYEMDYARELDILEIDYIYEPFKISYFDTVLNKVRLAIPDFYIPSKNEIVEIKSDFTLNVQNMIDKFSEYKKLGYNVKLILEKEEIDLYNINDIIKDEKRLNTIFNKNLKPKLNHNNNNI